MSFVKKLVAVVAVVAAVALAIPSGGTSLLAVTLGVSSAVATAVVAGLAVASSLLNRPKIPAMSGATTGRLSVSIDPRTPRKMVFGETAMGSDLRDMEYAGADDEFLHYFIVLASHQIDDVLQIYFDDRLAWDRTTGIQPTYLNYLQVQNRQVGTAANAINISPRMGSSRRYTGLAYTHLRFRRTGVTDKASSPFASSIPSRITTIGTGIPCYDPRQDSTVTGGSGPMRANNQATWGYAAHARNPACQMLTYLLGWKIEGRLAVGKGMPPARLDMQSFMAAANACDEPIALAAGGTQPRYRSDGIFSEADELGTVLDTFKATMNAELDDSAGKLALRMLLNDLDDPAAHFGPDDILSGVTWRPVSDISDRTNRIAGQYVDPRPLSLYQLIDYPEIVVPSLDGIERTLTRSFPLVQNPSQAQRTAKEVLQRQQFGGLVEFTAGHTGWRVYKYDIVTLTHPPLGFFNKLFRVADVGVGTHGQVNLVLREENAAIYAWDKDERAPVIPVAASSYNYGSNPVLQGIEAGSVTVTPPAPSTIVVNRSWDGIITPGTLPAISAPAVWMGSTNITLADSVSYSLTTTGGLTGQAAVDNTNGSPTKGDVTIPDTVTSDGTALLTIVTSGKTFGPFPIDVRFDTGAPPSGNAVGGGTDTTLAPVSVGTYVPITGTHPADAALDVSIGGPSESLNVNMTFTYNFSSTGFHVRGRLDAKAQYSPDGVAWTDIGAVLAGSEASRHPSDRTQIYSGSLSGQRSVSGLSAGIYQVRVVARNVAILGPTVQLNPQGTVISSKA